MVKCISERGDVTQASCDQKKKPESTRSCDMDSCPYWFAGKWTDVSEKPKAFMILLSKVNISRAFFFSFEQDNREPFQKFLQPIAVHKT